MYEFKKIDDYRWEIPKTGAMRVPGLVYVSASMLEKIKNEKVAEQVANVATLPGIVGYSLAMPDAHWGYGFCVGGVAATDISNGVISPGGIGFDISCLSGETEILHGHGYRLPIKRFEQNRGEQNIVCFDSVNEKQDVAPIVLFLKIKPKNTVYKIVTETGYQAIATEDHPFYTPDGMMPLTKLAAGHRVAINPFQGVSYQEPSNEILVDEKRFVEMARSLGKDRRGNALPQMLKKIKKFGLLPLRQNSPQLPYLLKLMGYLFGDGTMHFAGQRKHGVAWFYGQAEDLAEIKKDAARTGMVCSKVYTRNRQHQITTYYGSYGFETKEASCKIGSSAFVVLLACLGCPVGNKSTQAYRVPAWIFKTPLWQKRLFLSAFFGAEMATPKTPKGLNFYCPMISLSKREDFLTSGFEFLKDLSRLLEEFDVSTRKISLVCDPYKRKDGYVSRRWRLCLDSKPKGLINLYSKIGFTYNKKRAFFAAGAVQYLKAKKQHWEGRLAMEDQAVKLRESFGWSAEKIHQHLGGATVIPLRFIQRSIYEGRKTQPRIGGKFVCFQEWLEDATTGLGKSGLVWDVITAKKETSFSGWVYDFTVNHPGHNFFANGFVVSNCGIRLVRTDLKSEEIKPHMARLVDALYRAVPSGIGSKGKLELNRHEMRKVFSRGAQWAVENGYGWPQDLDTIEDRGCLKMADPEMPSPRAIERGSSQLGTLGSGNHFLEIQWIDEIYDENVARVFGLFKGQVVVLIHTGSRGCGYQICDDFLQVMQKACAKYQISLPDRQLACAPIDSPEGRDYFGAMYSGANFAKANRQVITHLVREVFSRVFGKSAQEIGLSLVYDVSHNLGKIEEHIIDGKKRKVCVHRKGATRAFPAGHLEVPEKYRSVGQPVLVPGSMGTASYVLVGTERAMQETYGTICHGAGRTMSRHQALKKIQGRELEAQLKKQGILIRTDSYKGLAEEAPFAYKDVAAVVDVCDGAGISKKVARTRPLGVVKG